jgi:cobalt-zinc-cadmium efflux system outer membrane protein
VQQLQFHWVRILGAATYGIFSLVGCTLYAPKPLPVTDDLATSVPRAGAAALDLNQAATIAILNNPDLKAARATLHVAEAQAFAAGLLPDPQLTWSIDHPTDHVTGPPDPRFPEYNAYGLSLSVDLQALLTHSSAHTAADASYRQARLDLLWQEWQMVAKARTVYVQLWVATQRHEFLVHAEEIYGREVSHSQRALEGGDVALDQAGGDVAVLTDIHSQLGVAARSRIQAEQDLHALLGVKPDVPMAVQSLPEPTLATREEIEAGMTHLPLTRPDLQALQAGYRSQEANLRKAVLSQFPNISLGFTHARDVSNVHTNGLGVTLTLPLFNRGRGEIAIQRATREQLLHEYQARLDQTVGDIWLLWSQIEQIQAELDDLHQRLPSLQSTVDTARRAYEAGDFSAASYLTLLNAYLAAHSAEWDLTESLWTDLIALATVMATQLQPAATAPATVKP